MILLLSYFNIAVSISVTEALVVSYTELKILWNSKQLNEDKAIQDWKLV